jgi:hypothetical protein
MNQNNSSVPMLTLRPFRTLTQRDYGDYKIHKTDKLPEFLSETPFWEKPSTAQQFEDISSYQGLNRSPLTIPGKDIVGAEFWMEKELGTDILGKKQILGIESGIRSTIVKGDNGKLFRLKGTGFKSPYTSVGNPVNYTLGGQTQERSQKERNAMDKIYGFFEEKEIPTPVYFAGQYEFDIPDAEVYETFEDKNNGNNPSYKPITVVTDIFEIKGDTRCDELFGFIDVELRVAEYKQNQLTIQEKNELNRFYEVCGQVVGQQVQILHNNGLVWNANPSFVNDYLGNKVFYSHKGKLHLGLLDFDNCISTETLDEDEITKLQEQELESIVRQAHSGISSVEPFNYYRETQSINSNLQSNPELRRIYGKGFLKGYSRQFGRISNEINVNLEKIISGLHRITETNTQSLAFMNSEYFQEGVKRAQCYFK